MFDWNNCVSKSVTDMQEADGRHVSQEFNRMLNDIRETLTVLAAFAKTSDLEVITFDEGFVQFKGLRHTILS